MSIQQAVGQARLGARYQGNGLCEFTVWAPLLADVSVYCLPPQDRVILMEQDARGYWSAAADGIAPGTRYLYRLAGEKERPDPASRFQPEGVHGPSEVIDSGSFVWDDLSWKGIPLHDFIIYELHIGTFTREGTFEAAIARLDHLRELGATAVEIMPVAQFPGDRNWGYDGVYPYAPQNTYGGPSGLKSLVNACHRKGLAVILDVVYNHLGPDGNYLNDFGPYFTSRYKTPWGDAVNYDGAYSDEVRAYFIQNALYWISEFHFDALRLDAIDAIYDLSARHVLAEMADAVHRRAGELGRHVFVIAESDLNDVKLINPAPLGGYGIDAQWSDDFHHALHALLTHERKGYYQDFGGLDHLKKAFQEGFVYSGSYSQYRKRKHGNSSRGISARQFIVCSQNHDQVGNRMLGERLSSIISFEQHKLAAGCVLLSPFIPLLFMGEEYGEPAPFLYFVSHLDDQLVKAVREGRNLEFAHFEWDGIVPDPQDESTFRRSKIEPSLSRDGRHRTLFLYYRNLIRLRRSLPALTAPERNCIQAEGREPEQILIVHQGRTGNGVLLVLNFRDRPAALPVLIAPGVWSRMLDSSSAEWGGPGEGAAPTIRSAGGDSVLTLNPHSIAVYVFAGEDRK